MSTDMTPSGQKGPENVVADYLEGYQQLELQSAETNVKKARNALFVVAGLTLVVNLVQLSVADAFDSITLIVVFVLTAIFAGLGFMTKKQPFVAIIYWVGNLCRSLDI